MSLSPYLDEKEVVNLRLKILEDKDRFARDLENYLVLLRKYVLLKQFFKWQKKRIKAGVDSVKENYSNIKDYEDVYSKVRAMQVRYLVYNITKRELDNCYYYTYKHKVTNPFELIK